MVSVIIPARNEVYLEKTLRSILDAARGDIEVVVVLDGYIPDPQIEMKDDRVTFLHYPESIGQRPAINAGAKRAKGKYILKTDAHSMFDEGFDIKLAADCEYDWTVIPRMYNLDVKRWKPKKHKRTDYMYIRNPDIEDKPFRAGYWYKYKGYKENKQIDDVMTGQGACFFMHKDRFWELGGMDEGHGQWGQMGVEIALKAWLSGGSLKVNKKTWFSHWFRGGGGPGFPWPASGKKQEQARRYSIKFWTEGKWPLQKRPLSWLVKKFGPVPTWNELRNITIIHLSANKESQSLLKKTHRELLKSAGDTPIVSVSHTPTGIEDNICVGDVGYSGHNILRQLFIGAKKAATPYIAVAESDCLYPPEHFAFRPPDLDRAYFNKNIYILEVDNPQFLKKARSSQCSMVIGRKFLIKELEKRLEGRPEWVSGVESGKANPLSFRQDGWQEFETQHPVVNVRHTQNMHKQRTKVVGKPVTEIPYWGKANPMAKEIYDRWYKYGFKLKKFSVDEIYENFVKYAHPAKRNRNKAGSSFHFIEVFTDFVEKVFSGTQFNQQAFEEHPYYDYLIGKLNPVDLNPLTGKGRRHVIKKMEDARDLCFSVKLNGIMTPIDIYRRPEDMVLERGGRRIVILKYLKYKHVLGRLFDSKDIYKRRVALLSARSGGRIENAAARQFVKLGIGATNKYYFHNYTHLYDAALSRYYDRGRCRILEIGVKNGSSMAVWREAFPKAKLFGIDIKDCTKAKYIQKLKKVKIFTGDQTDVEFLKNEVMVHSPFDVIIDDGSHQPGDVITSFETLWPAVKPGGVYVIEDLWHAGRAEHDKMMNMLKLLIDDIYLRETITSVEFHPNIVFITKA